MVTVQSASAVEGLDAPRAAVVATRMAELMGLYTRPAGAVVGREVIDAVIHAAACAGIAEEVEARQPGDPARAHALLRALITSPIPTEEIPSLGAVLGYPRLAALAGTSEASLRRYADGERAAPDDVAGRLHFLVQVFALLRGSFNEFGIRRWLERPRSALDGRTPGTSDERTDPRTSRSCEIGDSPGRPAVVWLAGRAAGPRKRTWAR